MLKSAQVSELGEEGFHYVTAITKPEIDSLIKEGVVQLNMFEEKLCEVDMDGVRYILRRNPERAAEMASSREDKFQSLSALVSKKNDYLATHPRASVEVALRDVRAYAKKLRIDGWVEIEADGRTITIAKDEAALSQAARLDGCYALKTDVSRELCNAETVHARYKDLALVERAFRTSKTGHLEIRPVYVRTYAHTRAHVFIVMLAYMLRRELEQAWRKFDLTVEEGLSLLSTLCAQEIKIGGQGGCLSVPEPRPSLAQLFDALNIKPPTTLPRSQAHVATKRNLPSRRKNP
jgi:transposase